jgi:hypothetical protein
VKQLTKTQLKARTAVVGKLNVSADALREAIEQFNDRTAALFEEVVEPALEAYNLLIEEADSVRAEIHDEAEAWASDRSDRWQESEAGSTHSSWVDDWSAEIEQLMIDPPDPIEVPELSEGETLEGLPEAAE